MRILLSLVLATIVGSGFAQQLINASVNDSIRVTLPPVRGAIQWQSSSDGQSWIPIAQQTSNVLRYKVTSLPVYLRASVVEGSCQSILSSLIHVTNVATTIASVATGATSLIGPTSASVNGTVSADGGSVVTSRGIAYATTQNPTIGNSIAVSGSGIGSFTANLTGLTPSTQYYARAFATNAVGTAYGEQQSFTTTSNPATTILMFVPHDSTYYSEYIVMRKALEAAGYAIDLRSSDGGETSFYMVPSNTTINETAATLPGGSYAQFTAQFQNLFGVAWDATVNTYPAFVSLTGKVQDVVSMDNYAAMVIVGGLGALNYRFDGVYSAQGTGARQVLAAQVQSAAEKLNQLAQQALASGKPVLAQCHSASLPAFWRVPNTNGAGIESLGESLLKGQFATGFPEAATATTLNQLGISHRSNDRVTISNPNSNFNDDGNGDYRIITTRDWYPQTVAHAARTLVNILSSYVPSSVASAATKVLVLHGGAVNVSDCGAANRNNDIPCNFGGGANIPADFTDIQNLLNADSPNDSYVFQATYLNLTGTLPFNNTNATEILNYYNQFDVILFFKHWASGVTPAIQNAMVTYVDNGGAVLALHHGLYNDAVDGLNKDIIVNQLFGAQSSPQGWSSNLTNHHLFNTNYGHYVSTFGITPSNSSEAPGTWSAQPLLTPSNTSYSYYHNFDIYDEIYNNMTFVAGQTFGRNVNQISPLFSNDHNVASQSHTAGFLKRVDVNADAQEGTVIFLTAGERKESINVSHRYGQIIRNAVMWLGKR